MTFDQIRRVPTSLPRSYMKEVLEDSKCSGIHESTLRAFQILLKVKELLDHGTSAPVVKELVAMMETDLDG